MPYEIDLEELPEKFNHMKNTQEIKRNMGKYTCRILTNDEKKQKNKHEISQITGTNNESN